MYNIVYLSDAKNDMIEVVSYIARDNIQAAKRVKEKILKALAGLKQFPQRGKIPADVSLRMLGYRMLVIDNYIAFYMIHKENKQVRIIRILHGNRNYECVKFFV